jgi:hypothetical protein
MLTFRQRNTGMETTSKWYAVPPYKSQELWTIMCANGELIATFEDGEVCDYVVDLHNRSLIKLNTEALKVTPSRTLLGVSVHVSSQEQYNAVNSVLEKRGIQRSDERAPWIPTKKWITVSPHTRKYYLLSTPAVSTNRYTFEEFMITFA